MRRPPLVRATDAWPHGGNSDYTVTFLPLLTRDEMGRAGEVQVVSRQSLFLGPQWAAESPGAEKALVHSDQPPET